MLADARAYYIRLCLQSAWNGIQGYDQKSSEMKTTFHGLNGRLSAVGFGGLSPVAISIFPGLSMTLRVYPSSALPKSLTRQPMGYHLEAFLPPR